MGLFVPKTGDKSHARKRRNQTAMVGAGYNQNGDLINGLLQGMSAMNKGTESENGQIILNIDGQTFARMIVPKLNKEYRRNGIQLV